jgi:two-component system, NarL family, nitrate/nitrite response regulator NarL
MALRALIVDDNSNFLGAASDLLEREGVEVVGVATTGAEAIRLAAELQPDVTLVDIDLGDESGFDVARALADDGRENRSPVVLVSTHAERDFADLIASSPAVGFVSKADLSARRLVEVLGH